MTLNDVEEDLPYTMGRLIAGARKKKNISLEELSQGVMSAEDLNFIEKDDEYADKTTWDFLLGRLGISPLIYECYVEQEEYDLFKARKEMREISNQIISNGLMSNERLRSKNTAQLKLLADQLEKRSQRYDALLNNVKNITAAIHQIFLANMKGYVILAKQRGQLCKADALKLHMESKWKRIYSSDAVSWIQKPHKVLMAVYEQEMLFLLAQGYEENGESEKAIQILTWLWEQRKRGGDPEENTRVLSFAAWKLAALEWNINRQEKAMEICQEAIDRSIQAESFRGLLPLLKQRLFFEKQLKWNQEEWDEQEKTIGMIDELFAEFQVNPYGLFVLTTFENARIADEIIRIRRKEQNLTQTKLSEGILEPESYSRFECGKRKLRWKKKKKLLERLGERGNKVSLLLESTDPDVVEEYQRIMDCSYREKYDLMKEKVYRLEGMLNKKSKIIAGVCVLLAVVLGVTGILLSFYGNETACYDFGKDRARGYDLSEHNGKIDWQALKDEVDFVFIRVGYRGYGTGKICTDKCAKDNLKNAQKAGIPFGVYFYSQAVDEKEAEEEARFVIKTVAMYKPNLPVVIDYEYPIDENGDNTGRMWEASLSKAECTKTIKAFCEKIEKFGYISGVYASSYLYDNDINTKKLPKSTVVWVADYNESVSTSSPYHIWQYSRTGKSDSIESKYVDLNYWYSKKQKG